MSSPEKELAEIIAGLRQPEKMISPKYFYDERGSQLFDTITHLPEYYPTETELRIMHDAHYSRTCMISRRMCRWIFRRIIYTNRRKRFDWNFRSWRFFLLLLTSRSRSLCQIRP